MRCASSPARQSSVPSWGWRACGRAGLAAGRRARAFPPPRVFVLAAACVGGGARGQLRGRRNVPRLRAFCARRLGARCRSRKWPGLPALGGMPALLRSALPAVRTHGASTAARPPGGGAAADRRGRLIFRAASPRGLDHRVPGAGSRAAARGGEGGRNAENRCGVTVFGYFPRKKFAKKAGAFV